MVDVLVDRIVVESSMRWVKEVAISTSMSVNCLRRVLSCCGFVGPPVGGKIRELGASSFAITAVGG